MALFYIGLSIIGIGLGAVGWLLYSEKKGSGETLPSEEKEAKKDDESATKILNRLGLESGGGEDMPAGGRIKGVINGLISRLKPKKKENDIAPPKPPLQDLPPSPPKEPRPGTATITTETSKEIPTAPSHLDSSASEPRQNFTELQEKYKRLDSLLEEKTQELEKIHKELASEIRNKKDFNKVKDILEKELKEQKDKNKSLQAELNDTRSENESDQKRITQLEEKVTKIQKDLLAAEDLVKEKDKQLTEMSSAAGLKETAQKENPEKEEVSQKQDPEEAVPEPLKEPEQLQDTETAPSGQTEPAASTEEPLSETSPKDVPPEPAPESAFQSGALQGDGNTSEKEQGGEEAPEKNPAEELPKPAPTPEPQKETKTGETTDGFIELTKPDSPEPEPGNDRTEPNTDTPGQTTNNIETNSELDLSQSSQKPADKSPVSDNTDDNKDSVKQNYSQRQQTENRSASDIEKELFTDNANGPETDPTERAEEFLPENDADLDLSNPPQGPAAAIDLPEKPGSEEMTTETPIHTEKEGDEGEDAEETSDIDLEKEKPDFHSNDGTSHMKLPPDILVDSDKPSESDENKKASDDDKPNNP